MAALNPRKRARRGHGRGDEDSSGLQSGTAGTHDEALHEPAAREAEAAARSPQSSPGDADQVRAKHTHSPTHPHIHTPTAHSPTYTCPCWLPSDVLARHRVVCAPRATARPQHASLCTCTPGLTGTPPVPFSCPTRLTPQPPRTALPATQGDAGDAGESDDEGEGDSECLSIDAHGRIAGASGLDYSTRSFHGLFDTARAVADGNGRERACPHQRRASPRQHAGLRARAAAAAAAAAGPPREDPAAVTNPLIEQEAQARERTGVH